MLVTKHALFDCYWKYYITPNYKIVNTAVSCNPYRYLTRFGWVKNS